MPRGASPKREREYEKLKQSFRRERRYPGREAEVAARIVNKQRRAYGETAAEKQKDREGRSPDRGLPMASYQHLTIGEVRAKLGALTKKQLTRIRDYERAHKQRKTLLAELERRLHGAPVRP